MWVPPSHPFYGNVHDKPTILGYPHFWKSPCLKHYQALCVPFKLWEWRRMEKSFCTWRTATMWAARHGHADLAGSLSWRCLLRMFETRRFPKIGLPPNHPVIDGISLINYPCWVPPCTFWNPPQTGHILLECQVRLLGVQKADMNLRHGLGWLCLAMVKPAGEQGDARGWTAALWGALKGDAGHWGTVSTGHQSCKQRYESIQSDRFAHCKRVRLVNIYYVFLRMVDKLNTLKYLSTYRRSRKYRRYIEDMSKGFNGFNLAQSESIVCMLPRLRPSPFCTSSRHCWKRIDLLISSLILGMRMTDLRCLRQTILRLVTLVFSDILKHSQSISSIASYYNIALLEPAQVVVRFFLFLAVLQQLCQADLQKRSWEGDSTIHLCVRCDHAVALQFGPERWRWNVLKMIRSLCRCVLNYLRYFFWN